MFNREELSPPAELTRAEKEAGCSLAKGIRHRDDENVRSFDFRPATNEMLRVVARWLPRILLKVASDM